MVTKRSLLPTSSATSIYLNFDGHSLFIPHLLSTHANSDKWRKVKNHAKFFLQAQIAHRASSSNSSSKKDQKKRKTEFSQGCNFFFKKSTILGATLDYWLPYWTQNLKCLNACIAWKEKNTIKNVDFLWFALFPPVPKQYDMSSNF